VISRAAAPISTEAKNGNGHEREDARSSGVTLSNVAA
jgi:hypothetical protein